MPALSDILRINVITELDGVSMSNTLFYQVDDLGDDDPVSTNLPKIATQFAAACEDITTTDWKIACLTYFNETTTEPKVVLPITIAGLFVGDAHPQHQVVRFNRYGAYITDQTNRRGALNLTGVPEALSSSGRLNDMAEFAAMELFLTTPLILIDDGWTLSNMLRFTPDSGFPLVQDYLALTQCQAQGALQVLGSRKTKLCATA